MHIGDQIYESSPIYIFGVYLILWFQAKTCQDWFFEPNHDDGDSLEAIIFAAEKTIFTFIQSSFKIANVKILFEILPSSCSDNQTIIIVM